MSEEIKAKFALFINHQSQGFKIVTDNREAKLELIKVLAYI